MRSPLASRGLRAGRSWHGWLVLAAYAVALILFGYIALPATQPALFWGGLIDAILILIGSCSIKGESPHNR